MPAFVHDEKRWERAKEAAGKQTSKDSDGYWALSNYIYHKMGKTEEDQQLAKQYKSEFYKTAFGGMMQLSTAMKTSVKIPKQKSMPGAFAKPSVFYKTEELCVEPKHPTLQKLRDFLVNIKAKNNG